MTVEELRDLLEQARKKMAAAADRVRTVATEIETPADGADLDALHASLDEATQAHTDAEAEVDRVARNLSSREAAERIIARGAGIPATAGATRTGREERTYRRFAEFVRDAYAVQLTGSGAAAERLERAAREAAVEYRERTGRQLGDRFGFEPEQRDVGTSAFAGLTVPTYLTDMYAKSPSTGRPTANICRTHELPASGMTVELSRITTATDATIQAAELDVANETNIDDTQLSVPVRTVSGMQDVSRQAVERASGAVDVVLEDIVRRFHARLNNQIVNGAGTSGTILGIRNTVGINAVTYTDASPTIAELQLKVLDGVQQIESALLDQAAEGPNVALMHVRRWNWLLGQSDSSGRPLVTPNAANPMNQAGGVDALSYGGVVGWIHPGLAVVCDNTIPTNLGVGTNQDQVLIVKASEMHLWEDPAAPFRLAFEHPEGRLAVRLIVYGFAAFTAGRYPAATSSIDGTGLIAPTF